MGVRELVLVVEDDAAIRRGVVDALRHAGYRTLEAAAGPAGLRTATAEEVDLVLLDVMLPELDGFAVLAGIRERRPALPVILLTARGEEEDRVRGLEGGADDYVVKPFGLAELLARVGAVLRRSPSRVAPLGRSRVGGREVDFDTLEFRLAEGGGGSLSEKEALLLRHLVAHAGRVVGRDELLEAVWGLDPRGLETRAVDMLVARLRSRLGDDGRLVKTVRSRGYLVDAEEVEP